MAEGLEVRIAHLEGAYEQLDKRLASVEAEVRALRSEMAGRMDRLEDRLDRLEDRMDSQFRWILGFQIASWLSIIVTLFALILKR